MPKLAGDSGLALFGASPVARQHDWPRWPTISWDDVGPQLESVLARDRWSVRSQYRGQPAIERQFASRFAHLHGCEFGVTAPSGTLALTLALEALGIGAGDEVIIPGLTWVACAIAVLNVGAIPVFADIEPEYLTISPVSVSHKITGRTRAIMGVHWHCSLADMPRLQAIAHDNGLALVEDAAQAHGGGLCGTPVGAWGDIAAFSLHTDKLLTCGEGGVATTNRPEAYKDMQCLRLDGYDWHDEPVHHIEGTYQESGHGRLMGTALTLSEPAAAIATAQLAHLVSLTNLREQTGERLASTIRAMEGFQPIPRRPGTDRRPFYEFAIRINKFVFEGVSLATICKAIAAEVGFPVYEEMDPLPWSDHYLPERSPKHRMTHAARKGDARDSLPNAAAAAETTIMFLHPPLLHQRAPELIADALNKVERARQTLAAAEINEHPALKVPLAYVKRPNQ